MNQRSAMASIIAATAFRGVLRARLISGERRTQMNPVVHFEMPAKDRKRMSNFYSKAFGWQTQMLGPDMGDYVVVTTTESDDNGPKQPGAINGGFFPKNDDRPAQYPSVVIAVDDIRSASKSVSDAGGWRRLQSRPRDIEPDRKSK